MADASPLSLASFLVEAVVNSAIDARVIVDHVSQIDTDAKLHASVRIDWHIALRHRFLDRDCALDCIDGAGELGEDAVARRVNDAATMRPNHWQDDSLMAFQVPDGRLLVRQSDEIGGPGDFPLLARHEKSPDRHR